MTTATSFADGRPRTAAAGRFGSAHATRTFPKIHGKGFATGNAGHRDIDASPETEPQHGFWRRVYDNILTTQATRAQRHIIEQLRTFDRVTLKSMGFSEFDIGRIRAGEPVHLPK